MTRSARLHADGLVRCPWPGEDPFYMAYHDTNGVCRSTTTARCTKSSSSTASRPGCRGSRSCASATTFAAPSTISSRQDRALQREKDRCPDERRRHRSQPRQDRGHDRKRKILSEDHGRGPRLLEIPVDFVDGRPKVNQFKTTASVPASTPLSIKISKELASRGFKFVGPTIVYAFMQATGMSTTIW